ncbi:MAG: hypothetical protein K0R87_2237 [Pseudonocardia sp.]|jgi:hypothetical protein|nr:hypothetical protein [Pseudonocardia sp.]
MSEDPSRSPDGANGVAGRVVPVFAVTGGRTRSAGTDLPMESLVTVTEHAKQAENLRKEYRVILDIAERPVSLVEVGAALDVPVGVARVLVSDLAEANYLTVHEPLDTDGDGRPSPAVLTRLLDGLRAR